MQTRRPGNSRSSRSAAKQTEEAKKSLANQLMCSLEIFNQSVLYVCDFARPYLAARLLSSSIGMRNTVCIALALTVLRRALHVQIMHEVPGYVCSTKTATQAHEATPPRRIHAESASIWHLQMFSRPAR